MLQDREARRSGTASHSPADLRSNFQRDRDRILYSEYFRRLAGVTQVTSAAEGGLFHNRLTHSLKVAQLGRRLAEYLLKREPNLIPHLDPDVVESACLAHDLGHPPFGHVADERLCELAEEHELEDGFEGNAQTFRIVSRLSVRRFHSGLGLDLTRATIAAIAKYPWRRSRGRKAIQKQRKKFSFFDDDVEAAKFIGCDPSTVGEKTLECQVMDLADSITYSVHDLEDFFRAGLIPLERLVRNSDYRLEFLNRWREEKPDDESFAYAEKQSNWPAIRDVLANLLAGEPEPGTQRELELLDAFRSAAITRFVEAIDLETKGDAYSIKMREPARHESKFLQRLIWDYVILNPRLATQQAGQIKIVEELFEFFFESLVDGRLDRIPTRFKLEAKSVCGGKKGPTQARFAIDMVATLTEAEAIALYKRITGQVAGSVLDMI